MEMTHFQAMLLFAVIISIAFAVMSRSGLRDRVRYAVGTIVAFLLIATGLGWLMYLLAR
jgi:hypothetical protein